MEIKVRNVNVAFDDLVRHFHDDGRTRLFGPDPVRRRYSNPNGSGETLTIPEPVTITYSHPKERVLFNPERDANPFFHLYESLWMLAGRNDAAPLRYYSSGFDFSDDGAIVNGAYGYRWRKSRGGWKSSGTGTYQESVDQLSVLIDHLKKNPDSRRAVLSMWNVEDDLLKIDSSKDVCCNLVAMFSLREEVKDRYIAHSSYVEIKSRSLDMTVVNRSNDLILGALGANAVHFSFLQEYVADCLGVSVGRYSQFTNNLHAYVPSEGSTGKQYKWEQERWLRGFRNDYAGRVKSVGPPLVHTKKRFDREVVEFTTKNDGTKGNTFAAEQWEEPFLRNVAQPMLNVFHLYKNVRKEEWPSYVANAHRWLGMMPADDWRIAAWEWLARRRG